MATRPTSQRDGRWRELVVTASTRIAGAPRRVRGQLQDPDRSTMVYGVTLVGLVGLTVFDVGNLIAVATVLALAILLGCEHRKQQRLTRGTGPGRAPDPNPDVTPAPPEKEPS